MNALTAIMKTKICPFVSARNQKNGTLSSKAQVKAAAKWLRNPKNKRNEQN